MKFDKILEYQKIDQDLLALETEVAKSKERAVLAMAKQKLDGATETIGRLSQEAVDLLGAYNRINGKIDKLKSRLDEFDGIIDDIEDAAEADYYIKQIGTIAEEISALERESQRDAAKIDEVNDSYKRTWEQGKKAADAYKSARAEYEGFVKARQPKVAEINVRLTALKNDIPQELLDTYNTLRQAKKLPAFVEYNSESNVCGRCFMDVPQDTRAKLKNPGDYTECPNCRRVLFIPEA